MMRTRAKQAGGREESASVRKLLASFAKQRGGEQSASGRKAWGSFGKQKGGEERASGRKARGSFGKWKGGREESASCRKPWASLGKQKASPEQSAPGRKTWAALVIGVSLLIVGAAERDIQCRSEDELRGRKLLWRLVSLNALGALGYFLFGRREPATEADE